jgi:hypothetical protein
MRRIGLAVVLALPDRLDGLAPRMKHWGRSTRSSLRQLLLALVLIALPACTFNIQPAVPTLSPAISGGALLDCKALLLIPEEFVSREYISSFEGREVRLRIGPPAAEAIEALVRSRISRVEKLMATGDGTLDFVRLASNPQPGSPLIMRPRFVRLESSVRPFRYNIEFGVAVDIAGLSTPATPSGIGIGTAGLYVQSEIQKAADEALSEAVTSLGTAFPRTCR